MKTTVIGAFPKISDDAGRQELRRALHRHDRGEIDDAALESVYAATTTAAINELEAAGVDVINDGQVRWDDLLAPFARAWEGVSRGPLERYYDNNTYFRQPVIEGPIRSDGRTHVREFAFARAAAKAELKAAVCGPLTFATLAIDRHYRSLEERTLAVADALAEEIRGLARHGAKLVDIEDPALVAAPQHIDLAREAYRRLAVPGVRLAVQTYFFPADRVLETLGSFPVAQVGLDLRSRETAVLRRLYALEDKTVTLGIVDARNTKAESRSGLRALVDAALKLVPAERLWLAPNTSLEFVPHDVARAKLAALVSAVRDVEGVPA